MKDFDAEKILRMSREELIALLGDELSSELNNKLADGTITYKEFEEMCQRAFPIQQQANIIRNAIFLKLSKSEGFNMFESNKEKQQQYAEIANLQEKAQKGEVTIEELKRDIKKDLDSVKYENDKTYLTDFLSELEAGIQKSPIQIKRAYEIYEEYTKLHGNSYVHNKWEELVKKGVL